MSEPIKKGEYPTIIRYSGYGRGNKECPNNLEDDAFLRKEKVICMKVDVRGQGLSTEHVKFDNYLTNGVVNKETYIYRGAFMDAVRAVDIAAMNEKSNGKIVAFGGSQGGLFSIVATSMNNKVTACVSNFPFMADIINYNENGWPMSGIILESNKMGVSKNQLYKTLSYFDAINFAKRINIPVFMACGAEDYITPFEGAMKVYKNIPSIDKLFYVVPCKGHGCPSKSTLVKELQESFLNDNM